MTPPWSAGEEAVVPVANCASGARSGERRSPQLTREPSRVPLVSLKKKRRPATPIEFGFDSQDFHRSNVDQKRRLTEPIRNPRIRASTRSRCQRVVYPVLCGSRRRVTQKTRPASARATTRNAHARTGTGAYGAEGFPSTAQTRPAAPQPVSPSSRERTRREPWRLARPNARVRRRVFTLRVNNDEQIAHLAVSHARVPRRRPDAPLNRRPMSAFSAVAPVRRVTQST